MSIFDRLRSIADQTEQAQSEAPVTADSNPDPGSVDILKAETVYQVPAVPHVGENVKFTPAPEPKKPVFFAVPDIHVDASDAKAQDEETFRAFWKFIHTKQPGLITQFQASRPLRGK